MSEKRWLYATMAAVGLLAAAPASAADAVALIMSVSGKVSPDVAAYSEIAPETSLDLGADGRISFVHYPSCRQVTVVGGKLVFGPDEVRVDGGTVERETPQKCPKKMSIKVASGQAAAVRFRSLSIPTDRLSLKPACVLVGDKARDFAEARVLQNDKAVATIRMNGPAFTWPASAAELQDGQRYKLVLSSAKPGVEAQEVEFLAAKDGLGEGECLLPVK